MNNLKQWFFSFFLFIIFISTLWLSSCTVYNDGRYLKDIPKSTDGRPVDVVATGIDSFSSIRIEPYDVLQVSIHTLDASVNSIFNQTSEGIAATTSNSGMLVDKNGIIVLPVIGKVKVVGLTTSEARDTINQLANIYLKDPIVNVRLANFKITVLGEVTKPAQILVPDEKVNVIDAIGLSGDLTVYGKRNNVLLIRHTYDAKTNYEEKKYIRLNLASNKFTNSPYFYLKQGDVLYVEPVKQKFTLLNPRSRDLTMIASLFSVVSLIIAFSKK